MHSLTKFLAGHGDVLGGVMIADQEHEQRLRSLARTLGPGAGSVRSLPDHARHQDLRAARGAAVLQRLPSRHLAQLAIQRVARVHFLADPKHPDAADDPAPAAGGPVRRDGQL